MIDKTFLEKLIIYIVVQLIDQEGMVSKIRIVKFLYLIDIEHYRMLGRTLTGLNWVCYKFGPYAFEIDTALQDIGYHLEKEEVLTSAGHTAFVYRASEVPDLEGDISYATQVMIDRIIARWAAEDTRVLLDHVYEDTEPMQGAMFGEKLDFSKIQRAFDIRRRPKYLKIDAEDTATLKQMLEERRCSRQTSPPPQFDEAYYEAMHTMAEEEQHPPISGRCHFTSEAAKSMTDHLE